jgi:hypothetical protein
MLKEGWYSRAEAGFKHIAARCNTKHRGRMSKWLKVLQRSEDEEEGGCRCAEAGSSMKVGVVQR